jgi:cation diffusion facilitator family transporter
LGGGRGPGWTAAWAALAANLGLAAAKLAAGLWFGSQAVLADGVHSLADAAGSGAVLYGMRVASDPPDAEHPWGHEKAEAVAAFAVAVLLVLSGLAVAGDALGRLLGGGLVRPGWPALGVALLGLAAKLPAWRAAGKRVAAASAGARAVRADSWSDLWSSLGAAAGVGLARAGVPRADAAMALLVSALTVASGVSLGRANLHELLEGRGAGPVESELRRVALGVAGVEELHAVRTRTMGPYVLVDLKIGVDGDLTVRAGHEVAQRLVDEVHRALPNVREVLVHVNPARGPAPAAERRAPPGA